MDGPFEDISLAAGLIALAALSSPISQLTLAPVFGSIPSSINHNVAIILTFLFGFLHRSYFKQYWTTDARKYLPLVAVITAVVQYALFYFSDWLGPVAGPIYSGFASCHTIIISAAYAASTALEGVYSSNNTGSAPRPLVFATGCLVTFVLLERFFADNLPEIVAQSAYLTPAELQLIVAAAFALLCGPSAAVVVATWLLIIGSYLLNPHGSGPYADSIANSTLTSQNWTLLARQWSTIGYISVLQNEIDNYRVLRCDHSLLGGEWLLTDTRRKEGWTVNEPIYSVFSMLEAVRLVQTQPAIADTDAKALVIGLGIGTAPKALIAHGIDTTVVELDGAVHAFATQFFDLPTNHTPILRDAISWVAAEAHGGGGTQVKRYEYIIHDVFTGGAEPLPLFTSTFLRDLRSLLTANGVAAINYAGDLRAPLTRRILNTIDAAFDRQCRIFSDEAAQSERSGDETLFSNLVVFCRNAPGELVFRKPTARDFLGSKSKQSYLFPSPQQEVVFPLRGKSDADVVLDADEVGRWRGAQERSAVKHWRIMRTVVPGRVWEMY